MYEFAAQDAGEISVAAGQIVDVLNRNGPDWWRVRYNGQEGLVPAAYVKLE
jgi:myosin-1